MKAALRGSAAYATVLMVQRVVSLLLLPLYTRALSPAQYGELGVLIAVNQVLIYLFSFGQDFAVIREWFQFGDDHDRRRQYLGTVGLLLLVGPFVGTAVLSAIAVAGGASLLQVDSLSLVVCIAGTAIFVTATILPFAQLRAQERLGEFVWINAVGTAATVVLTVGAVVTFHFGVLGWAVAYAASNLVQWAVAAIRLPWPWARRADRRMLGDTLRLGLPMLPHQSSLWGLQLGSRAILVGLVSHAQLGLYTIATVVAQMVSVVSSAVNRGVMPSYGRAAKDRRELPVLSRLTTLQVALVAVLCVLGALFGPALCLRILPPSYHGAASLIPWLVLANGVFSLYAIPMNAVSIYAGKAGRVWVVTVVSAAINIGLLYVLVPASGTVGAAYAAIAGATALLAGLWAYAQWIGGLDIPHDWPRIIAVVALSGGVYAAAYFTTGAYSSRDLVLRGLWCLALGALVPVIRVRRNDDDETRAGHPATAPSS